MSDSVPSAAVHYLPVFQAAANILEASGMNGGECRKFPKLELPGMESMKSAGKLEQGLKNSWFLSPNRTMWHPALIPIHPLSLDLSTEVNNMVLSLHLSYHYY